MEKLLDNGINLHKSIAMGLYDEAYGGSITKPRPKPKVEPEGRAEDKAEGPASEATESY